MRLDDETLALLCRIREGEYGSVAVDTKGHSKTDFQRLKLLQGRGMITYRFDLKHFKLTAYGLRVLRQHLPLMSKISGYDRWLS